MQLESMVTDSKFDDILFKLTSKELCAISRIAGGGDFKVPLVTATVSKDRFMEFIKMTAATCSKPADWHPRNCPAVFLRAYPKAGGWLDDNPTGIMGIWLKVGGEL